MNKKIIILWLCLIVLIFTTIIVIGYSKQDYTLIKLERNIISNAKKYIKENNIIVDKNNIYIIKIDELIKDNENIDKYCIKSVKVTKDLIFNNYEINKECEVTNN